MHKPVSVEAGKSRIARDERFGVDKRKGIVMRLLKAGVCFLGFLAFILFPGTVFSEEILLFVHLYTPNVCSQSAADDFKPIVQSDLLAPEGFLRGGPTLDLLTDEELDSVSAEGLVVTFEGIDAGEPAIILWDEAMGTVTEPGGYGDIHVERR